MKRAVAAALLLLAASAAGAQEIRERLAAPDPLVLKSAKPPIALELCVADAISRMGVAATLRDGPQRTVITATSAYSGKVAAAVELNGSTAGTTILAHFFPAGSGQRFLGRLQACT